MLVYANGKTRVWNVETHEFRRSTGLDAADEMLTGDWDEMLVGHSNAPLRRGFDTVPPSDLARLVELDMRQLDSLTPPSLRALLSGIETSRVQVEW